jgi:hypothetical protein
MATHLSQKEFLLLDQIVRENRDVLMADFIFWFASLTRQMRAAKGAKAKHRTRRKASV